MAMIAEMSPAAAGRIETAAESADVISTPCHTVAQRAFARTHLVLDLSELGMTASPALSRTDQAQAGLHEPCVLLKLGEIVLKGRNRQQFERLLQNNIRVAATDLGVGIRLWQRDGVIVLNPAPAGNPEATPTSG